MEVSGILPRNQGASRFSIDREINGLAVSVTPCDHGGRGTQLVVRRSAVIIPYRTRFHCVMWHCALNRAWKSIYIISLHSLENRVYQHVKMRLVDK